eukprot:1146148-Pelagomonas_calceolata.AAC.2
MLLHRAHHGEIAISLGLKVKTGHTQKKEGKRGRRKEIKGKKRYDKAVHGECQARREPHSWKSEIKRVEDQKIREHI